MVSISTAMATITAITAAVTERRLLLFHVDMVSPPLPTSCRIRRSHGDPKDKKITDTGSGAPSAVSVVEWLE
jgi:Mrp family chromosome partitioning ATPase